MKIVVNGVESNHRCLLYENNEELLEVTKDRVLGLSPTKGKVVTKFNVVELEEKGKNVTFYGDGKKFGQLKDVRITKYDFN